MVQCIRLVTSTKHLLFGVGVFAAWWLAMLILMTIAGALTIQPSFHSLISATSAVAVCGSPLFSIGLRDYRLQQEKERQEILGFVLAALCCLGSIICSVL